MILQIKTLLRVKRLKQDQALRTLQQRRRALEEAGSAVRAAEAAVDESLASLPAREDAIFAEMLGRSVKLDEVDKTKARILVLHVEHQLLVDEQQRAVHVEARALRERDEAVIAYRDATKVSDKYTMITEDLVTLQNQAAEAREDGEVEEMFSKPRRKMA
ncbi:MAG: type III secretion system stalk subunit SctO [Allorhizobium sp.]